MIEYTTEDLDILSAAKHRHTDIVGSAADRVISAMEKHAGRRISNMDKWGTVIELLLKMEEAINEKTQ